jgi:RNA polymerase sigma factor (sigma-70 family)
MNESPLREDDATLHAAWRAGDRAAGEVLFHRHFNEIFRFFRGKVRHDVNDLVQRTFLGCVESRDSFRGASSFRVFLFAIARHELCNYFRAKRKHELLDFGVSSLADLAPSPSSQARRLSEKQLVAQALRSLALDLQIALELHYWEGLRGPDLAYVLGIPEGTVRSRLRRGLSALRETMNSSSTAPLGESESELAQWLTARRPAQQLSG